MFAILISEENLPKILETPTLTDRDIAFLKTCCGKQRYFVTGYVTGRGRFLPWIFFFQKAFEQKFEYDPTTIQTDWDQIVRK